MRTRRFYRKLRELRDLIAHQVSDRDLDDAAFDEQFARMYSELQEWCGSCDDPLTGGIGSLLRQDISRDDVPTRVRRMWVMTVWNVVESKLDVDINPRVSSESGVAGSANRILDTWAALLPARIASEDLGDYVENIQARASKGQRFRVYLRVVAAIFWTGINAIGYARKVLGKSKAR
jgi:hypothetical protein